MQKNSIYNNKQIFEKKLTLIQKHIKTAAKTLQTKK